MRRESYPHARLIRHGESAANAGGATSDPAAIALTEAGWRQAHAVGRSFTTAPALIITSPFLRARQTAEGARHAFPQVPVEQWAVQEFTYLAPARCLNTTTLARRQWVQDYWQRSAPDWRDGPGAETFSEFIKRVQRFLHDLARCTHASIAVFSHGQFISAVAWLVETRPRRIDTQAMASYYQFEQAHHLPNAGDYWLGPGSQAR